MSTHKFGVIIKLTIYVSLVKLILDSNPMGAKMEDQRSIRLTHQLIARPQLRLTLFPINKDLILKQQIKKSS